MARVRAVDGTRVSHLNEGWEFAASSPGSVAGPADLERAKLDWSPTTAPTTVAGALRSLGRWSAFDRIDFDDSDWWFRALFPAPRARGDDLGEAVLRFGGLATLAEVWIDGSLVLTSSDMFLEHDVPLPPSARGTLELVLAFRSLGAALKARRPRPRWKTRLVSAQQLRWHRTTLLGRIPAWTPPAAPVGPYRSIRLEERTHVAVVAADVRVRLVGPGAEIHARVRLRPLPPGGAPGIERVDLRVGDASVACECVSGGPEVVASGVLPLPRVERWWPHTHGPQPRAGVRAIVSVGGAQIGVDLGQIGFRELAASSAGRSFALRVNGEPIFCRGACWTPLDPIGLAAPEPSMRETLLRARSAGMNMVRVCGPFLYEEDLFYDLCDELGILVWQDHPFSNMDYPAEDPAFCALVEREADGFLMRTQLASSLAVLCGNSEVEQQAAMMGAPPAIWRSALFSKTLAQASERLRPDVPYWPSTPSGGALPFTTGEGTAHYFGVGAYLRPLEDARRADVGFATECLAFANVPSERAVDDLLEASGSAPTDPLWKRRTPRDGGVGWDFEDVRDHYLRLVFGVDPVALRYADVPRYLALSRVVTGEVMAATFAEWRRAGSTTAGALVWFLRDLWPGPGWGVLDSEGRPKAAYYYLKRALAPLGLALVDEGLNGLDAHIVNESNVAVSAELRLSLFRRETPVRSGTAPLSLGPRSVTAVRLTTLLGEFYDLTYAYKFGPPGHDVAVATLVERESAAPLGQAFHFPGGLPHRPDGAAGLQAVATPAGAGCWDLAVRTNRLALAVAIDAPGFEPDDNYFHLAPGMDRTVTLRGGAGVRLAGSAQALNADLGVKITINE